MDEIREGKKKGNKNEGMDERKEEKRELGG